MSLETKRQEAIRKYTILAAVQALLGVGLLTCGILGTMFTQDDDNFDPPYFIGGYIVGVLNILAAMLASCIVVKAGSNDVSATNVQEAGCAMVGHCVLSMFSLVACFLSLIFAGVFGTGYETNKYDTSGDHDAENAQNHKVAYAIIAGSVISVFVTIVSMCLLCYADKIFGAHVSGVDSSQVIVVRAAPNSYSTYPSAFSTYPSSFSTQSNNHAEMEQLRSQNLLLRQQLTQQQQLQQQGFSGEQHVPPPPSYNSIFSSNPPPYSSL